LACFFQAEDGIRDFHVTGVQTCALPICWVGLDIAKALCVLLMVFIHSSFWLITNQDEVMNTGSFMYPIVTRTTFLGLFPLSLPRSEERRVGKGSRSAYSRSPHGRCDRIR